MTFPNLRSDALRVVPAARNGTMGFVYLTNVLRDAPVRVTRAFWRASAEAVLRNVVSGSPIWLNIAWSTRERWF